MLSSDGGTKRESERYRQKFLAAINDDLNLPKALAVVWELMKSDYPGSAKKASILKFDQVLGLRLAAQTKAQIKVSQRIKQLLEEREKLREEQKWQKADEIRKKILKLGYQIEDRKKGPELKKIRIEV